MKRLIALAAGLANHIWTMIWGKVKDYLAIGMMCQSLQIDTLAVF